MPVLHIAVKDKYEHLVLTDTGYEALARALRRAYTSDTPALTGDERRALGRLFSILPHHEPKPAWHSWPIGKPVMVRGVRGSWHRRYFAGVNDEGRPQAFLGGGTSWSARDATFTWREIREPAPEELSAK